MPLRNKVSLIAGAALLVCAGNGYAGGYPQGYPRVGEAGQAGPDVDSSKPAPASQRFDPPDAGPPPAVGPIGTSGVGADRYDNVGYATWYGAELSGNRTASGDRFDPNAFTAAHRTLPLGSFAEVTSLDTGHTILVLINDRGPADRGLLIDLSHGAAKALGVVGKTAVRIRRVAPPPSDVVAIRSGQSAAPRLDTPPAMLVALKSRLSGPPIVTEPTSSTPLAPPPSARPPAKIPTRQSAPISSPARVPVESPTATSARGRYFVQIAALSNKPRALQLAKSLGGLISPAGAVWRVRLGPYVNASQAAQARDAAARRGYGDARVVRED